MVNEARGLKCVLQEPYQHLRERMADISTMLSEAAIEQFKCLIKATLDFPKERISQAGDR